MHPTIARIAYDLSLDTSVRAILLTGSHARGDAAEGSDVDFWVLLSGVLERRMRAEAVDGVWVEIHFRNGVQARDRLRQSSVEVYSHLDGKSLHDPGEQLGALREEALAIFGAYQTPEAERREIAYWLASTERKLRAALAQHDVVKMGYLASTHGWKVLEGVWAANHKPMPPSGSVEAHLGGLELPMPAHSLLGSLFAAPAQQRAETALNLIGWVLPRLG